MTNENMHLITELESQIESKQDRISELGGDIADMETSPDEWWPNLSDQYDEILDDVYLEVCEALPVSITGSQLIREFDPIMYRCGYADYLADHDITCMDECIERQSEIEDLESEIEDLEEQIEDLQTDDEA